MLQHVSYFDISKSQIMQHFKAAKLCFPNHAKKP